MERMHRWRFLAENNLCQNKEDDHQITCYCGTNDEYKILIYSVPAISPILCLACDAEQEQTTKHGLSVSFHRALSFPHTLQARQLPERDLRCPGDGYTVSIRRKGKALEHIGVGIDISVRSAKKELYPS